MLLPLRKTKAWAVRAKRGAEFQLGMARRRARAGVRRLKDLKNWAFAIALAWTLTAPALICLASYLDGTWFLDDDGKGFCQHFGVWAIFATAPLLLILTRTTVAKFVESLDDLERGALGSPPPAELKALIHHHSRSIRFQHFRSGLLVILLMVIGFYCAIVNVRQTINPMDFYGNDVFDAAAYPFGFYSFKAYLFVLWGIIYPVVFFQIGHISYSLLHVFWVINRRNMLCVDFFHEDDCGGMSVFGKINLGVMAVYLLVFLVVYAIRLTHAGDYWSIWFSIVLTWLLFVAQSFINMYYIQKFVRSQKSEYLKRIGERLNQSFSLQAQQFPSDLLMLREHVSKLSTFPYTTQVRFAVNAIRVIPAVIFLTKLLFVR